MLNDTDRFRTWLEGWRHEDPPLAPFHWEIEFTEVFERQNPGFDGIVGNPPFLGGKRITTVLGTRYRDWLATLHTSSNSNADLVAHFFPPRVRSHPQGRHLRPDCHQHHSPRRYAINGAPLDLRARRRTLPSAPASQVARTRRGCGERATCAEGKLLRHKAARRQDNGDDHRILVPPRWPLRRSATQGKRGGKAFRAT